MTDAELVHVSDPVTWSDLCARFPAQWIVLVAIDWEDMRLAFVAGYGAKREALAIARPLFSVFEKLGCFHTGGPAPRALPLIIYTTATPAPESRTREPATAEVFAFA